MKSGRNRDNTYAHLERAGPINVKAGVYRSRIKTPTKTGAELVINGKRVTVKQTTITFIHRSDGYAYRFTPINTDLLQDLVI